MQWLSKSCHFMHLMQNRCTRILQAQEGRDPGGRWGGGIIIQLEVGGACHKEFHYFSSHIEKVDCAYCNFFFSSPYKPLNNLGSFQGRSFPFSLRSLPRVQGRGAQSPRLKETLTHRNTPCHRHRRRHLLLFLPPVLPSALHPHSILYHFISLPSTSPPNHCPCHLRVSSFISLLFCHFRLLCCRCPRSLCSCFPFPSFLFDVILLVSPLSSFRSHFLPPRLLTTALLALSCFIPESYLGS